MKLEALKSKEDHVKRLMILAFQNLISQNVVLNVITGL